MTDTASNGNKHRDQSAVSGFSDIVRDAQRLFDLEQLQEKLLATQHQNNLEIHEKQAALSRELHEKQEKSSTRALIISVGATILAALLGIGLGRYLPNSETKPQLQQSGTGPPVQTISAQKQASEETAMPLHKKALETAAQAAVALKNVSSEPHSKPQKDRK